MIAIMSALLVDTLARLAARHREVKAGRMLFRAGDAVVSLFVVSTGAMRLTRALAQGTQLTLQRAGPGEILAEASLFASRYHCDCVAAQTSVVKVLPRRRVTAAFAADPELAEEWARHLARSLHRARAQIETHSLKTVAERLDAWLTLNEEPLPPKGRWRQLASEISVSPEALYRELARRRK